MNIIIIANTAIEPGMSGGTRILIELSRGWIKRGMKVVIHTSKVGKNICDDSSLIEAKYRLWPSEKFIKFGMFFTYFIGTLYNCYKALLWKPVGKVVVWSTSDFWPDALPGLLMKLRFPKKVYWIGSIFLFPPNPRIAIKKHQQPSINAVLHFITQKPIYWLIRKFSQMIFVTNEDDRKMVIKQSRLSLNQVVAIRGGVDLGFINSIPDQRKKYMAIFIGRIHRHKGILELMDIWRQVVNEDRLAKLVVLGEGPQEEELRIKINKLNLNNNVKLLGFIDGKRKYQIIKSSKMFLHSSVVDSGGMTGVEAMASGLPSVGYNLPAFKTYYPKGMLKAPIGDKQAFAGLILQLSRDIKLYIETQKAALEWSKGWDWDKNSARVLRLIQYQMKQLKND